MRIDNGQCFSASFLDAVNSGITAQGGITSSAQISANTLNADGIIFTAGTASIRNTSNNLLIGYTAEVQSLQLGRAGTDMNLVGTLASSLTASNTVAISGANAINGDRLTAASYVQTPSIQNSDGVLSVSPPTTFVSSVTASAVISGASEVNAVTGSFSHMVGNSPITFGSPVTFLSASNFQTSDLTISGSLTVSGSGTFNNIGPFNQNGISAFEGGDVHVTGSLISTVSVTADAINIISGSNQRKVQVITNIGGSDLNDGDQRRFYVSNNKVTPESVMFGSFSGGTGGVITASIIQPSPAHQFANPSGFYFHIWNESGANIPASTGFTASFVIM